MSESFMEDRTESGSVKISNDVVAIIAGVAATEVKGIIGMSGGFSGGISDLLGMKNLSKGVKVQVENNEAVIDLFVLVEYGSNITKVGKLVQENVKSSVENMTGLKIVTVNVHIQGVSMPKDSKTETDKTK